MAVGTSRFPIDKHEGLPIFRDKGDVFGVNMLDPSGIMGEISGVISPTWK
jgi:hypothetical protein